MIHLLAAIVLVAATAAGNTEKVEKYPDGAKHLVYNVGSNGTKNGAYKEFFADGKTAVQATYRDDQLVGAYRSFYPNGKLKISAAYRKGELDGKHLEFSDSNVLLRSASYRAGKLNGPNQEFVKGQLTKSEFWIDGKLILPKSAEQIATEVAAINRSQIKWVGKFPEVIADVEASLKNPAVNLQREAALRALMSFRCVCGLAYDLAMDRDQTAHAQAAAHIMSQINGQLSHTPANPGLPDDEYKFAYKGTSSSNLHMTFSVGRNAVDRDERLGRRFGCREHRQARPSPLVPESGDANHGLWHRGKLHGDVVVRFQPRRNPGLRLRRLSAPRPDAHRKLPRQRRLERFAQSQEVSSAG